MKKLFDTPQLKEGTYRAFIWEPGTVIVVILANSIDDIYKDSAESFAIKVYNELFEYNLSFDILGDVETVNRLIADGCEEVVV